MEAGDWHADAPATLVWIEALDHGDPAEAVAFRDGLYGWAAPFTEAPRQLLKTVNRFKGVLWGDAHHAVVNDEWWDTRDTRSYVFSPAQPASSRLLFLRDAQDRYADPGRFSMVRNGYGEPLLRLGGSHAWLIGEGYSADGQFPFVDRIDLATGHKQCLYRSSLRDRAETIVELGGSVATTALVRIESSSEYPDYYLRTLTPTAVPRQLTRFGTSYPLLHGVHKQVLDYRRADGVALSGVLYLPVGLRPQETRQAATADLGLSGRVQGQGQGQGQCRSDHRQCEPLHPARFQIAGVLGHARLRGAGPSRLPDYRGGHAGAQRHLSAATAGERQGGDRCGRWARLPRPAPGRAIGGHSYGAFMVANLLTHTDWFAAGIARSGAYNRTLTPFGFQREERTYWQAPEVYERMSPLVHAERMKTPLLLIHGQDDGNAGHHTIQSERYFDALKALGAPVRLVLLPRESHAYQARESVLHLLWEQDQWLQRYLSLRPASADAR